MPTKTNNQTSINWILAGYNDNKNKTLYKNAPSKNPPELPDYMLPTDWQYYFKGFYAGNQDSVQKILKSIH